MRLWLSVIAASIAFMTAAVAEDPYDAIKANEAAQDAAIAQKVDRAEAGEAYKGIIVEFQKIHAEMDELRAMIEGAPLTPQ